MCEVRTKSYPRFWDRMKEIQAQSCRTKTLKQICHLFTSEQERPAERGTACAFVPAPSPVPPPPHPRVHGLTPQCPYVVPALIQNLIPANPNPGLFHGLCCRGPHPALPRLTAALSSLCSTVPESAGFSQSRLGGDLDRKRGPESQERTSTLNQAAQAKDLHWRWDQQISLSELCPRVLFQLPPSPHQLLQAGLPHCAMGKGNIFALCKQQDLVYIYQ